MVSRRPRRDASRRDRKVHRSAEGEIKPPRIAIAIAELTTHAAKSEMRTHGECLFHVNGRTYACPPKPIVAICLDGSSDEYLDAALLRGLMPNLQQVCLS